MDGVETRVKMGHDHAFGNGGGGFQDAACVQIPLIYLPNEAFQRLKSSKIVKPDANKLVESKTFPILCCVMYRVMMIFLY